MQQVRSNIKEVPSYVQKVNNIMQEERRSIQEVESYIKKCAVVFEK